MPTRRLLIALAAAVVPSFAAAPADAAPKAEWAMVNSYIPARIDSLIGFIPSHGMNRPGHSAITKVRYGGKTFRFFYQNSAAVWPGTGLIVKTLAGKYASTSAGGFIDRPLTARERKRLAVRIDLGRDADVLVVAQGHPACAPGLTRAQVRGIVRGTITRWSQVAALPPGAADEIALRVESDSGGFKLRRFGITRGRQYADGARGARDGGLGAAASGDQAVAGVTSWSRARGYGSSVCAVPIDGVAPAGVTVFDLSYPGAFPITYVVPRRPYGATRYSRALMKGFTDWLAGPDAAGLFRQHGMMLVVDGPPEQ